MSFTLTRGRCGIFQRDYSLAQNFFRARTDYFVEVFDRQCVFFFRIALYKRCRRDLQLNGCLGWVASL